MGGHGLNGAFEDFGLVLGTAEDGSATGEVAGDGVSGADAADVVFGGEDDSDEAGATPAGDGAGASGVIDSRKEMQGVQENIVFDMELLAESLDLLPCRDKVPGLAP